MLTKLRLYTRAITLFNAYLLLSVTACSSVDVSRSYPDDNIDTKLVNLTARQETKQIADAASLVEASFIAAQSSNLDYFSPYSWRQVNTDIRNMRSIVLKFEPAAQGMLGGPNQAKVMAAIDQAQASIARAERQKTAVKDYFSKVFTATEFLKPHINTLWQRDVDRINADLTASIIEFEADPSLKQHQQTRASLQMRLHRLEVDIVRDRYYDPLHNQLKQFDSQLIPRSYAKIKYQLQLLDNQIVDAPRDTQQREQAIALVNKEIQRTRHVVADVNWINDLGVKASFYIIVKRSNV